MGSNFRCLFLINFEATDLKRDLTCRHDEKEMDEISSLSNIMDLGDLLQFRRL